MDKFPKMMNVTFIMHLNVCIAGITVCHSTIGMKSNYDPQSFKIAIQIGKIWKILENCQNFKLIILQKFSQQCWFLAYISGKDSNGN